MGGFFKCKRSQSFSCFGVLCKFVFGVNVRTLELLIDVIFFSRFSENAMASAPKPTGSPRQLFALKQKVTKMESWISSNLLRLDLGLN